MLAKTAILFAFSVTAIRSSAIDSGTISTGYSPGGDGPWAVQMSSSADAFSLTFNTDGFTSVTDCVCDPFLIQPGTVASLIGRMTADLGAFGTVTEGGVTYPNVAFKGVGPSGFFQTTIGLQSSAFVATAGLSFVPFTMTGSLTAVDTSTGTLLLDEPIAGAGILRFDLEPVSGGGGALSFVPVGGPGLGTFDLRWMFTPTPEPGAWLLAGGGILALLMWAAASRKRVGILVLLLAAGLPRVGAATPLTWYLNAQAQTTGFVGSGQAITGFFTYDTATGFSINWNLQSTGGILLSGPFPVSCAGECLISSSSFDPTTHTVAYQTCLLAGGICYPTDITTESSNFDDTFSFSENNFGYGTSTVLDLELTQPLTDAGGTIPLIPAATCMPFQCSSNSPGSYIGGHPLPASPFFLTPLTGTVTAVPEPRAAIWILGGVAVLLGRSIPGGRRSWGRFWRRGGRGGSRRPGPR